MAIPAVDSEAAHMVRVAERHRLLTSLRLPRRITGAVELRKRPGEETENEDRPENRDPGKRIGAVMKNLGHSYLCPLSTHGLNGSAR